MEIKQKKTKSKAKLIIQDENNEILNSNVDSKHLEELEINKIYNEDCLSGMKKLKVKRLILLFVIHRITLEKTLVMKVINKKWMIIYYGVIIGFPSV